LTNGSSNEFKTDYYQTKASVKTLEPKLVEFQIGSDGGLFTFDENAASTQLIDDKKYADSDTIILPKLQPGSATIKISADMCWITGV
jgi:hypothetical protein